MLILRPHHLVDIIAMIGTGEDIRPHPYGHAVHSITKNILENPKVKVKFINGADDICKPCMHLQNNKLCKDVLDQLNPPISKQDYNNNLDQRVFDYLGIMEGDQMGLPNFLNLVKAKTPGIEKICTHPMRVEAEKLSSIKKGLEILGNL